MKNKSQLIGQIFIFIFALAVFAMLVSFGYKYVKQIQESHYTLSIVDFRDKLSEAVERIRYRTGSVEKLALKFPQRHLEICFVDSESAESLAENRPLLHSLWSGSKQNVFLQPLSLIPIILPSIKIDSGYCCLTPDGTLNLRLEALPDKVKISPWELECEK
ncbi:hypothetical protein HYV79_01025 [Candidatus Woesearchaeota archaeon]|nr:hypothetical protein [Candidatus Woesearchaeota archaeon]